MVRSLTEALITQGDCSFYDTYNKQNYINKHGKQNIITGLNRKRQTRIEKQFLKNRKNEQNEKVTR